VSKFFEQELRKLFGDGQIIQSPAFTGRACLGDLGKDIRARAEFVTIGYADHYEALRLTVLNRTGGKVDVTTLRFKDVWGIKKVPGNPNFRNGLVPHIWIDRGTAEWYAYQPNAADRQALQQAAAQYLDVFRERTQERSHDGPKIVYICAPLRGEVEANIEFARQKAREVFQSGNIPICPHLMFPPIADPNHPIEDQTARDMGLRLVASCQQVNVYGSTWTEGMWAEIRHAEKLGIPVVSDQKQLGKAPPRRTRSKQER